jgi:hypothetical protein
LFDFIKYFVHLHKKKSQAMSINIAVKARRSEPGYRYVRDPIKVVHEHFKGTVTRITNLPTLARQLRINESDLEKGLTQQIKRKLGLSTCKPLTFPNKLDATTLDDVLQSMIEQYMLCPQCALPEWNQEHCDACGYNKPKKDKQVIRNK